MPRETLTPMLPDEMIGLSTDRCYCTFNPEDPPCAPCQARNPHLREPELMDDLEPLELEDRLAVALDNEFAREVLLASENREPDFNEQVAVQLNPVTLKIIG